MGVNYGAVMISEGVFHALSDEEIENSGLNFTYDDHGHPELGKISKAAIFSQLVDEMMSELGLKVKTRPVEIGYDIRCTTPIAYDRVYCSLLGFGVYKLFSEGVTGCMVYVNTKGDVAPLYLKDIQAATGKIPPRLVDINSQRVNSIIDNMMHYITPADYEFAKKFLENPEKFDFRKILNW
jgi:6-phosphofructokinase 1